MGTASRRGHTSAEGQRWAEISRGLGQLDGTLSLVSPPQMRVQVRGAGHTSHKHGRGAHSMQVFSLAVTFWAGQAREQENPGYTSVCVCPCGMRDHRNSSLCWPNTDHPDGGHFPQLLILHKAPAERCGMGRAQIWFLFYWRHQLEGQQVSTATSNLTNQHVHSLHQASVVSRRAPPSTGSPTKEMLPPLPQEASLAAGTHSHHACETGATASSM